MNAKKGRQAKPVAVSATGLPVGIYGNFLANSPKISNFYLCIKNMNLTKKNAGLYSYKVSKGSNRCH